MTSYGRAEIENVNYASGDIFDISSATRVRFPSLTPHLASLDKLSKNSPWIFYNVCRVLTNFDEILHPV